MSNILSHCITRAEYVSGNNEKEISKNITEVEWYLSMVVYDGPELLPALWHVFEPYNELDDCGYRESAYQTFTN